MAMVCGLDLDREQITFDAVEVDSGEVWRGRGYGQPVAIAVEGCTGWRDVVEEITAAGFEAHLAEPAETQAARGPKRRAKTDRSDCKLLRDLLVARRLPESWIPPTEVLEWREPVPLYESLVDQRTQWVQRIHAELFQHPVTVPECAIRYPKTRCALDESATRASPRATTQVTRARVRGAGATWRQHDCWSGIMTSRGSERRVSTPCVSTSSCRI
jgi:Transposase